jgi:hypothetical protein
MFWHSVVEHISEWHHRISFDAINHKSEDTAADSRACPAELHEGHCEREIVVTDGLVILTQVSHSLLDHEEEPRTLELVEFVLLVEYWEAAVLLRQDLDVLLPE